MIINIARLFPIRHVNGGSIIYQYKISRKITVWLIQEINTPLKNAHGIKTLPVWFLPDGKDRSDISSPEVRQCTVPQGKALLIQIVGSGSSTGEGFRNDQELLDRAVWGTSHRGILC
jgi:hypothetical protein